MTILVSGEVQKADLPVEMRIGKKEEIVTVPSFENLSLKEFRDLKEREYIVSILKNENGNITTSAKVLGLERTHLHRKLKDLKIEKVDYLISK